MSGKGKKKNRIKPKAHEIEINDRCINLKRFAYDVLKHTALSFHIPESCIAVWDDKHNDYERDDFFFLVCTQTLLYQTTNRHFCHAYFSQRYEENKLAESKLVKDLLYDVIKEVTEDFTISPIFIVNKSLSVACELYLFLYSKDMDLYPKKLAEAWYDCYLKRNIKKFEAEGGFQEIYNRTTRRKCEIMNAFLDKFIENCCLPYETSANNPDLEIIFYYLFNKSLSPEDRKEMKEELEAIKKILDQYEIVEIPDTEGATGFNLPESTGKPIVRVPQFSGSFAAASQEVPTTIPEIQPWFQRDLTIEERKEKLASKCPIDKDTRKLILDSLETKQSTGSSDLQTVPFKISFNRSDYDFSWLRTSDQKSGVSTVTITTQSNVHQGAESKDRIQNTGSSDFPDILPPFEKGIRQLTFRGWGKQSSDQKSGVSTATFKAQSNQHQGTQLNGRAQNTGSSDLQNITPPFEKDIRQSISGSLLKQSSDQKPVASTATVKAQSNQHQGAEPNGRAQNTGSSDLQTGESSGTSRDETGE